MTSALMTNYGLPELEFSHGKGSYLYTDSNEAYLDFTMGIAVNCLGHCHPRLVHALSEQANQLWHTSNLYSIKQSQQLATRLTDLSFADKVFFCNSGTEAVECGFKIMRRYQQQQGNSQRCRIIAMSESFHGRTLAPIAASANPLHTEGFLVGDNGFDQAQFGDIDSLRKLVNDSTAGIIIEPIQGEGGIRPAAKQYLADVRALCDELDILLMFDEVQCGVARTGTLFAYEQYDVIPDILASAKGLGGGFPVGATLATDKAAAVMVAGTHGSTFGGNPLAMAVANAVIDEVSQVDFLQQVNKLGAYLTEQLQQLVAAYPQLISEVNGKGLMLGVKCLINNGEFIQAVQNKKLLLVKAGAGYVRLLPALNVSIKEVDLAIGIMRDTLANWDSID